MTKRSGYVAIIGRPNVGKSTLLNQLVGEKLAGVSPKPQTTRGVVRGILTRPDGQIIYVDTPGLHNPQDSLGHWMIREIEKSVENVDLVYLMVLPGKIQPLDAQLVEKIKGVKIPVMLVVNQVDRFPKTDVLPVLEHFSKVFPFREFIPISAKTGDQLELLLEKTIEHLPEGEYLFPEDQISDQQERMIASEMIREKIFHFTQEEIPYATTVLIDLFKEREDGIIHIQSTVVVDKDSQKAIIIGKKGDKLKQIGSAARIEIEKLVGKKVFLELWVKVIPHWKRDENVLRRLGYE